MTQSERDSLILSQLEHVSGLLHAYATSAQFEYDDLRQDACIVITRIIDAGTDAIHNLPAFVTTSVRNRIIDLIRYRQRRRALSLDASVTEALGSVTLADLLPSPYYREPIMVVLAKERLAELHQQLQLKRSPQTMRMLRELEQTALASLSCVL
jgi:DNA-directed RNA polymerase specialized sigma24 family protein